MGEIVEMDKRGRITIPAYIRKIIGKDKFRIELINKNTIVLKAVKDKYRLIKTIEGITLKGDEKRVYEVLTGPGFYGSGRLKRLLEKSGLPEDRFKKALESLRMKKLVGVKAKGYTPTGGEVMVEAK